MYVVVLRKSVVGITVVTPSVEVVSVSAGNSVVAAAISVVGLKVVSISVSSCSRVTTSVHCIRDVGLNVVNDKVVLCCF